MKSKSRISQTAEIFTPTPLVNEILDKLNETDPTIFTDPAKTFLDNSCGNSQFLIEVIRWKIQNKSSSQQAISTTFGVDIMVDNVCDSIARIVFFLKWHEEIFDEKGQPIEGLSEFGGYEDGADFNWLEKNHVWVRTYTLYNNHTIKTRPNKDKWWLMEYTLDDKKWVLYHWIICADALKYHYRFDDTYPDDERNKARKQEEFVNRILMM